MASLRILERRGHVAQNVMRVDPVPRSRIPRACLALLTLAAMAIPSGAAIAESGHARTGPMSIRERIVHQTAVEEVLWQHRIWPAVNPQPKPALRSVVPAAAIQKKVEDALRMTTALQTFAGQTVTGAELQAEMDRQALGSQQPGVLRELWGALGNDPQVIAEILARPTLVERRLRDWYERQSSSTRPFDAWWQRARASLDTAVTEPAFAYQLPSAGGDASAGPGSWNPTHALPEGDVQMSGVWTGSELIIWGGTEVGGSKFNSGSRYDPATDTWRTTSGVNAPPPRKQHSAVWTGTEMIVWGGCGPGSEHQCETNTGGRYNPVTDTWTATTTAGAPGARIDHTAVWTGSEMIVWGGCRFVNDVCTATALGNTGGRYDPAANSWKPTTTTGAPAARLGHTAVWTGQQMIVWGGVGAAVYADGARYDPAANTWTPTATLPTGVARYDHTAVWTGSQMIMWGGTNGTTYFNNGARYVPGQNRWRLISSAGAPQARARHSAVWTGSEMIVWGGCTSGLFCDTLLGTGGRYDPAGNTWTPTSTTGAPSARQDHVAVWTGSLMIVWGGGGFGSMRVGGRYDPATNTWTPTNANEATSAREWHTAVWTGAEFVVWGGDDRFNGTVNTGGVYDPATDSWTPTAMAGAPSARMLHTAVWTGSEMIVWGGQYGSVGFKTGGRYNPATNTWTPTSTTGAPEARSSHSAVWTGTEMIVWGGSGFSSPWIRTGGRYNPSTNSWVATTLTGAPSARSENTAVWTGSQMVVWGGATATFDTNTGGRYDPATNTWTPTSTVGAPVARNAAAGVWTGSRVLVWGGSTYDGTYKVHRTGALYDPISDVWTPTSLTNAPSAREFFAYVWTATRFVVWGGCTVDPTCLSSTWTGGEYDPVANSWTPTSEVGGPSARGKTQGAWTGTEMIVWGGETDDSGTFTNTGGRYTPLTA